MLIFRILWGVAGSSTARFSTFISGPRSLIADLKGKWRGTGHSPLGGLSVVVLLLAVAIQVGLGLISEDQDGLYFGPLARLVSSDNSDRAAGIHAAWFNVLLALIVLHVGAILYYRLRGRGLTKPMITGRAKLAPGTAPMKQGKWWIALICLAVGIGITRWVIAGAPPFSS